MRPEEDRYHISLVRQGLDTVRGALDAEARRAEDAARQDTLQDEVRRDLMATRPEALSVGCFSALREWLHRMLELIGIE